MTTWTDGYVNANGIRIHYYRTGGDKPQVVLSHGITDDGLCWTRVAKELEQNYDVIMFDARGHGLSDSGQGDYMPETRATDLAEAIIALGLDKPVVGGHSLGADVSIYLAAMYPDLPRAIFLEDPPINMPGEPMFGGAEGDQGRGVLIMMMVIMMLVRILPTFMSKPIARKLMPVSPDDEIIPWIKSKKRFKIDVISALRNAADEVVVSPFDELKKITVPTLLLMGDRDLGSIVSPEVAQEMAKALPGLQIAHLKGANHDIRRAKFEEYMQVLRKFLDEV
ncbi:MAG: alpha/beta hydrolase [Chloroflexi bacterium]|nr:alpha/beta hydrolase [Chloroflexota bacterium]